MNHTKEIVKALSKATTSRLKKEKAFSKTVEYKYLILVRDVDSQIEHARVCLAHLIQIKESLPPQSPKTFSSLKDLQDQVSSWLRRYSVY